VPYIPKYSAEDTTFVIGNEAGETTVFPIAAGNQVVVDVPGLHYNRKNYHVRWANRAVYRELHSTILERPACFQTGKIHG